MPENEKGIIHLSENPELRGKLERKYTDYCKRLDLARAENHYIPPEQFSLWYAKRILGNLLETGELNFEKLSEKIAKEHGGHISRPEAFFNYFEVIADYAVTGGKFTAGSTGLK